MPDLRALSLPVETDEDPCTLVQPLAVALVVKGFDSEGRIAYWTMTSPDLTGVESLGMFTWAAGQSMFGE